MKLDIKLTKRQALKIAKLVYENNFRVFGIGNFHIDVYEFAEIIEMAFNENNKADDKILDYYKDLLNDMENSN